MGFFADFKAKRAATAAAKAHSAALADWEDDRATLAKLITVFTAASKGEDSVPNTHSGLQLASFMKQVAHHLNTLVAPPGSASR